MSVFVVLHVDGSFVALDVCKIEQLQEVFDGVDVARSRRLPALATGFMNDFNLVRPSFLRPPLLVSAWRSASSSIEI